MSLEEYAMFCAQELAEAIHYAGAQNVAAFLATPVGTGEDYGLMPPAAYWQTIREICKRYDVLLIADEVVTGFGRTGTWFAMEHFGVQADIMTTAKGISSLYIPLGAVTVSDQVNEPFRAGGARLVHGFTNAGHALACAAGLAVIDILHQDGLVENSAEIEGYLHAQKERLLQHPGIADVRGRGLLLVAELVVHFTSPVPVYGLLGARASSPLLKQAGRLRSQGTGSEFTKQTSSWQ
jgi:adenosylmethionine-8-amino-7-oxononanoate aminotransferase